MTTLTPADLEYILLSVDSFEEVCQQHDYSVEYANVTDFWLKVGQAIFPTFHQVLQPYLQVNPNQFYHHLGDFLKALSKEIRRRGLIILEFNRITASKLAEAFTEALSELTKKANVDPYFDSYLEEFLNDLEGFPYQFLDLSITKAISGHYIISYEMIYQDGKDGEPGKFFPITSDQMAVILTWLLLSTSGSVNFLLKVDNDLTKALATLQSDLRY